MATYGASKAALRAFYEAFARAGRRVKVDDLRVAVAHRVGDQYSRETIVPLTWPLAHSFRCRRQIA